MMIWNIQWNDDLFTNKLVWSDSGSLWSVCFYRRASVLSSSWPPCLIIRPTRFSFLVIILFWDCVISIAWPDVCLCEGRVVWSLSQACSDVMVESNMAATLEEIAVLILPWTVLDCCESLMVDSSSQTRDRSLWKESGKVSWHSADQ